MSAHRFARLRAAFVHLSPSEPFPTGAPAFVIDEKAGRCCVVLVMREGAARTPHGWLVPDVSAAKLEPAPPPTYGYRAAAHPGMRFYANGTE